jgi:uracil-DNA glycosylase family 4
MPMPRETKTDLADLARQLEAQLKFYVDIGVTDIGGAAMRVLETSAADSGAAIELRTAATPVHPDEAASGRGGQLADESAVEEDDVTQASLFGNPAGVTGDHSRIRVAQVKSATDSSLDEIRLDIGDCVRCKLHVARTNIVFGEGNPQAKLVFVGEGPGADEDASGRPFVGRAGQLLNKIIEAIGLKREDVYICNVVKCRPPGNRNPEPDEVATCEPFLFRQLRFIQPKVIVTLGLPAFQCLLKTKEGISRARGEWRDWNGIRVMPTFHPAYLLRSPDKKREAWDDMKKVRDYLSSLGD